MRKTKKQVYRPVSRVDSVFICPGCGKKQLRGKKGKKTDDTITLACSVCDFEREFPRNDLTEPIDAYGELIDEIYAEAEYSRLMAKIERLLTEEQFTESLQIYSLLANICDILSKKFLKKYEETNDPENQNEADTWKLEAESYRTYRDELKASLDAGELVDAELVEVYTTPEDSMSGFGMSQEIVAEGANAAHRQQDMNEVLGDTGFLEW